MGHVKVDMSVNAYTQVLDGAAKAADRVGSECSLLVTDRETKRRQVIEPSAHHTGRFPQVPHQCSMIGRPACATQ